MMLNLSKLFGANSANTIRPVALVSLDGWGLAPPSKGNAISLANTANMDSFFANYPHGQLIASGESVGLPAGEVGNSEVGHLTMGVGRVIYQSLKRINLSIADKSFFDNKEFQNASEHVKKNNSKMHLIGLVSSGNVHASLEHLFALLQFFKKSEVQQVYLHLFTDGRDAPPNEGESILTQIQEKIDVMKVGTIASVSGRYFAMDRDARWERIAQAYGAIVVGVGKQASSAVAAVKQSYAAGKSDEFVEPTIIPINGKPVTIDDNDGVVFFNFRVDRARELTMAITLPNFENADFSEFGYAVGPSFVRSKKPKNLFFVSMTEYHNKFPVQGVAFPPQYNFPDSLPEIMAKQNITSLHLAESEKERMVTYYFRGMRSEAFSGEQIDIVPSAKVATYDKKPEMSAPQILDHFKRNINKNKFHFAVLNFANPDMVAHSGNIAATIKAIEILDKILGILVSFVIERNGTVIITADHGNAEEMLAYPTKSFYYTSDKGDRNTDHSSNPVPVVVISKELNGKGNQLLNGTLADIAPTILAIMNIAVPGTMTGTNLLKSSPLK